MAKTDDVNKAITTGQNGALAAQDRIEQLLERVDVKKRFLDVLGANAPGFISSIISAVKSNEYLKTCDQMSVISSAAIAATLNLPINPSLGFAFIVPYKGKAQFQIGWKGLIQLAQRTGLYRTMNAAEVYEGELKSWNRITGDMEIDTAAKTSDKVIGYVSYFRLLNGFEKYFYMTVDQVERHARKYSQSYAKGFGPWKELFGPMALKTVTKLSLSKWGPLSIEMQKALRADQAVINTEGEPETYPDAINAEMGGDAQEPVDQAPS